MAAGVGGAAIVSLVAVAAMLIALTALLVIVAIGTALFFGILMTTLD